jgi:D-alanyl-D-alanine carboxypeptidase/D-alanyl-D-alanine-endopeptidase (penicillin-binding protein 4)
VLSLEAPGELVVKGSVAADAGPVVTTYTVTDPASFARSALIDELTKVGVSIAAAPTGANPTAELPAKDSYAPAAKVAALTSAPLSETITMVLKTSHNPGADLFTCMLAVRSDSTSCNDGLATEYGTAKKAGIDPQEVYLFDGAGTSPARFTPAAGVQLIDWTVGQSWGSLLKQALPNLGVSGDLELIKNSPAQGKIQAKTGTRAAPDPGGSKILVQTRTMVGYLEAASGRDLRFALMVQNMDATDLPGLFTVIDDVTAVATAIQQSY